MNVEKETPFFNSKTVTTMNNCLDNGIIKRLDGGVLFEMGTMEKGVIIAKHDHVESLGNDKAIIATVYPDVTSFEFFADPKLVGTEYHFDSKAEFVIFLRRWSGYEYEQ